MNNEAKNRISEDWSVVAARVEAYEDASHTGWPVLEDLVNDLSPELRVSALKELVAVELERRWKSGQQVSVEQYLQQFPELNHSSEVLQDLYRAEYEARHLSGDRPNVDEFKRRYSDFQPLTDRHSMAMASTTPLSKAVNQDTKTDLRGPKIGRYIAETCLGTGAFGDVYRCHDPKLDRKVAVKVSRNRQEVSSEMRKEFQHEARAAARVDHPGIVRVLDTDLTDKGQAYIVYEYIEGLTLEKKMKKGDYSPSDAVQWIIEVAEALHEAHKQRLVHRDIKPSNILIDRAGKAHLTDFGMASLDDTFFTSDYSVIGTYAYMSPEQARGTSHWATSQADIYSLGTVLYQLLCHQLPFSADTRDEMRDQILHRAVVPPRSIDDRIPKQVEATCLKALSKDPESRHLTAKDMADELRQAMLPKKSRSLNSLLLLLVILALGAVATLGYVLRGPANQPQFAIDKSRDPTLVVRTKSADGAYSPLERGQAPLVDGDVIELQAISRVPAYFYIFTVDASGTAVMLWPISMKDQAMTEVVELPNSPDETYRVVGSSGGDLFLALVADASLNESEIAEVKEKILPRFLFATQNLSVASEITRPGTTAEPPAASSDDAVRSLEISKSDLTDSHRLLPPSEVMESLNKKIQSFHGWAVPHRSESQE